MQLDYLIAAIVSVAGFGVGYQNYARWREYKDLKLLIISICMFITAFTVIIMIIATWFHRN